MRAAALAALLATALPGQDADPVAELRGATKAEQFAAVARRLSSDDPAELAWGGWIAGELALREAAPELRAALRRLAEERAPSDAQRLAALNLLDALIRVEERPAADELTPFLTGLTHDAAFVLLAAEAGQNAATLLELLAGEARGRSGRAEVFHACGNLLAAHAAAGAFTRWLLDALDVELTLLVVDSDDLRPRGFGSRISGACGDGAADRPPDFPPIALYRLTRSTEDTAFVVAPGAVPVSCRRRVVSEARFGFGSARGSIDVGRAARTWLAGLVGTDLLDPLAAKQTKAIDLRTNDFLIAGTRVRDRILDAFDALVAELVRRDLLSEKAGHGATLAVSIDVQDQRKNRDDPLPAIPPRR